jgi:hypothetical protein
MLRATLLLFCFAVAVSTAPKPSPLDGKWFFRGSAGWQRIEFDFDVRGRTLNGSITMGPGVSPATSGAEDWEYFFEPATFPIQHGRFDGTTLTFDQEVARGAQTEPNELLKYTGRLNGDHIEFTRESFQRMIGKCKLPPEYCLKDTFVLGDHKIGFVAARQATKPSDSPEKSDRSSALAGPVNPTKLDTGLDNSPVNLLLVFDHNRTWFEDSTSERDSASYGAKEWTGLRIAVRDLLTRLRPSDSVAIADMENFAQPCVFESAKVPCSFYTALEWTSIRSGKLEVPLDLTQPFPGQKDLYEGINHAAEMLQERNGRKIAVFFTDGRDGRLSPRWLRTVQPIRTVTLQGALPMPGVRNSDRPPRFQVTYHEALDPLYGLTDTGESTEFDRTVTRAVKSGARFYFIAIHSQSDPEFGPALVGRRISGLFPGSNEAIDNYIAQARLRMERIAQTTGGQVFYGETPEDAISIYESLDRVIGLRGSTSGRHK